MCTNYSNKVNDYFSSQLFWWFESYKTNCFKKKIWDALIEARNWHRHSHVAILERNSKIYIAIGGQYTFAFVIVGL